MTKPLFPSPSADFDHPIDILDGCHERIKRSCTTIENIAEHIRTKGNDAEARVAAVGVMRYFDTAGMNHHHDEEEDLFPTLARHTPPAELPALFTLLHRLRADHLKLDNQWAEMRARLMAVVEGREIGLTPVVARQFSTAYSRHIALEEAELLPLARRVLDAQLIAELGGAMAQRRRVVRDAA